MLKVSYGTLGLFAFVHQYCASLELYSILPLFYCPLKFIAIKGTVHFFLEIGKFYKSPRVKKLSFIVFESIQPISGAGGSTFSIA